MWFLGRGPAVEQGPGESVSSPSLEFHKSRPDETLSNLVWPHHWPYFQQDVGPKPSCSHFPTKLGLCDVRSHSKSYHHLQPATRQRRDPYPASSLSTWHFGTPTDLLLIPSYALFCPIRQNPTNSYLTFHSPPSLGACRLFSSTNRQALYGASLVFLSSLPEQRVLWKEQWQTPLIFVSNHSD